MKRNIKYVIFFGLITVVGALIGCQNSTGQLFSPSSDIHVAGINPSILQPVEESSDSGGGSESAGPTLPHIQVYFKVSNGVSVFLNNYIIRYYTPDGASLANGRYDISGAMSAFIQAPEIRTFDSKDEDSGSDDSNNSNEVSASIRAQDSGGSEQQQTIPSDIAGYTTLEAYSPSLYLYLTRGNGDPRDDITPVVARITIHGRDLNDKEVSMTAQTILSTSILKKNDN